MKIKATYKIQQKLNDGPWKTIYNEFETQAQADMYYRGTNAFNGYKCRILKGRKVIAQKGD